MKIGFVFHHDPIHRPPGIDTARLAALTGALEKLGLQVQVIAPVDRPGALPNGIAVRPLADLAGAGFDLVKTCYHQSIELVKNFDGPVVSRIVRVVDEQHPKRDGAMRAELLRLQGLINDRASAVAFNNPANRARWQARYPGPMETVLTPTGCPAIIPPAGADPFAGARPAVLFLGSLAAPRMVELINHLAESLRGRAAVHLVGANKTALYGGRTPLSPLVIDHGQRAEPELWDYVRAADMGLALAAGPDQFDNDLSKIYYYLRGGVPVVIEQPAVQVDLVRELGHGLVFDHGDRAGLVAAATEALARPFADRTAVMEFMARNHAWDRRAEVYRELFRRLIDRRGDSNDPND